MSVLQSLRQQSVRDETGTALDYNSDWSALFDDAGIAAGPWNGRLLAWINDYLGTSYTSLPAAQRAFAVDQGYTNWSSMGTFDAAGIIDPSTLPNLVAWFRKGVGVTEVGGLVSQWADQSGNARHLIQATETNQPALQGDGSILFDGIDNHMAVATWGVFPQPFTVYVLGKQITWTSVDRWFDASNASDRYTLLQFGSSGQLQMAAGVGLNGPTLALDTYGIITTLFNGATSAIRKNLEVATTGDAGTASGEGFRLGARGNGTANWGNIQFKEVLLYSGAHDEATQDQIIRYLASVQEADDPAFFI